MTNIIEAAFSGGTISRTKQAYQYDYGQILKFTGLELPQAYEVHFANSEKGNSVTQIGDSDGVAIPDSMFQSGAFIYAWVFLHTGNSDGETEYKVTIPIIKRAKPTNATPTPVQQDAITEAIAALNAAVEQTGEDVSDAAASAAAALASEQAAAASEVNAAASESAAAASEVNAAASESAAASNAAAAATSASAAAQSATAAAGSASSASGSAETATTKASEAASSASTASGAASTATTKASEAATSATNAGNSATAAAGSASTASTAATTATGAKSAAQAAQTAAETAQGKAETAQGKAEDAQGAAETAAQSVSASAAQIAKNASDIERLNAGVDVLFDFHKTSLTWGEIVALIEGGEMSEIFPVASQIKDVWKNTSDASVEFPWDVVHYSENGDTWLKLHYAAPETLQFDAPEAIYYFDGTEPAGTYHIPIGSAYGTGWVVGHSIQFTLTAAPDEGDQLFIDCGTNNGNDPADGRAWRVYDAGGTTVKQSGTTSEGTGGTSLGTIGNVNAHRTNGRLCAISRVVYGYARWSQSAMRQYLNSADVNWWIMKNPWDRPPAQASTIRGFLCGFSQDFLDHLEETEVVTALNTHDGFAEATETTLDKIFLPSLEQMYINPQLAGVEGESWDYYKELAEEAGLPGKFQTGQTYPILITYNASNTSSAVTVVLRSCPRGVAYSEWSVTTSGGVGGTGAGTASRGCPACKFKKSAQS